MLVPTVCLSVSLSDVQSIHCGYLNSTLLLSSFTVNKNVRYVMGELKPPLRIMSLLN